MAPTTASSEQWLSRYQEKTLIIRRIFIYNIYQHICNKYYVDIISIIYPFICVCVFVQSERVFDSVDPGLEYARIPSYCPLPSNRDNIWIIYRQREVQTNNCMKVITVTTTCVRALCGGRRRAAILRLHHKLREKRTYRYLYCFAGHHI
jgi:hypothetical protein